MNKVQQLQNLQKQLQNFSGSPLYDFRTKHGYQPVLGAGDPNADVMFIGEAPGENEAKNGKPFCGAAGRFLDKLLASIDLTRGEVFITSIVHDRPPENRDPTTEEIQAYQPFLNELIAVVRPQVIAPLGRYAAQYTIEQFATDVPTRIVIGDLHGTTLAGEGSFGSVVICPLYHPAAALYNGSMRETLLNDMETLQNVLAT